MQAIELKLNVPLSSTREPVDYSDQENCIVQKSLILMDLFSIIIFKWNAAEDFHKPYNLSNPHEEWKIYNHLTKKKLSYIKTLKY